MSGDDAPRLDCPECDWHTSVKPNLGMAGHRLDQHLAKHHAELAPTEPVEAIKPDAILTDALLAEEPAPKGIAGKVKSRLGRKPKPKGEDDKPRGPRESRPRTPTRKRASLDSLGEMLWKGLASSVERAGYVSTPRVMALESPIIGSIVDDGLKGTPLDRLLQPIARLGDTGQELAAAIIMPIAAGAAERNPQFYPQAAAMIRWGMVQLLPRIKTQIRKEVKEQQELDEVFADLGPMLGLDRPATFDDVMSWVFAPPPPPPVDEPGGGEHAQNGSGPPDVIYAPPVG